MNTFQLTGKNVVNPDDKGDLWVVSGRIPGYDDDAVHVVVAENDDAALQVFIGAMTKAHGLDESKWQEIEDSWGDRLFINYTFKFAERN